MDGDIKTHSDVSDGACAQAVQRITDWYESLSVDSLSTLGTVYNARCYFRDPFREIHGLADLENYFSTLFTGYRTAGFRITHRVSEGSRLALYWTFHYERRWLKGEVHGSFFLELDEEGKIFRHVDYWDTSEQIYENLPVVGRVFRWIKSFLSYATCGPQIRRRNRRELPPTANQIQPVVPGFSSPGSSSPGESATVVDLFLAQVAADPKRLFHAVRSKEGRWTASTFEDARKRIWAGADGFRRLGLKKGDGVAILAGSRPEWMEAELAVLSQGGHVVGLDVHARPDDLTARIIHSGVRGLVVENNALLDSLLPGIGGGETFVVILDGAKDPGTGMAWNSWERMTRLLTNSNKIKNRADPDETASVVYTSGSTGEPKAIRFTHRQIVIAVHAIRGTFPDLRPGDHTLSWLPLAHQFQRMTNWVAMNVGAVVHFVDDPRRVVQQAREVRPTVFVGVPRFYEKLVDGFTAGIQSVPGGLGRWLSRGLDRALTQAKQNRERKNGSPFAVWERRLWNIIFFKPFRSLLGGRVKLFFTGSAPLPPRLMDFFHAADLNLIEGYAMSENTVPLAVNQTGEKRLGSVGRVLPPNQIRLADDGEVLVRGPGLFNGYWKTESTPNPFTRDGYFKTGDLGHLDDDGFLFLVGRKDDLIKTSTGRKISPSRLEAVYGSSPLFERVVVVGNNRPGPLALVWVKKNSTLSFDDVGRELARLGKPLDPHERVQQHVLVQEELSVAQGTLTPSLKLKRRVIEERFSPAPNTPRPSPDKAGER